MSRPTPGITEEQLKKLSLRAIVVYTTRCAKRVLPFYAHQAKYFWGKKKDIRSLQLAVKVGELFATGFFENNRILERFESRIANKTMPVRDPEMDFITMKGTTVYEAAEVIANKLVARNNLPAAAIASAASSVAATVAKAANTRNNPALNPNTVVTQAIIGDINAGIAALAVGVGKEELNAKLSDYELLSKMQYSVIFPELGDTIELYQPLWPNGEPNWS